jgi:hypothetical protein
MKSGFSLFKICPSVSETIQDFAVIPAPKQATLPSADNTKHIKNILRNNLIPLLLLYSSYI